MADFPMIKHQFDTVHKTYVTVFQPYHVRLYVGGHLREFDVELVDTQNLVPESQKSLAVLGKMHGFDKLDPGKRDNGEPYIEQYQSAVAG
jgi:hypothetical protein